MSVLNYIVEKLKSGIITFINAVTLANRDYPYHDYAVFNTILTYQAYVVGTNNVNKHGSQSKCFVSKSTLIYTTQDAYLVLNDSRNVVMRILRDTWYTFESNIYQIFVSTVETDGMLYAYFEGVLPQEQRSAE